jgi:trehalose-phosphatase
VRSLWSEWPKIRKRIAGKNLILLCDYDGTLAPIVAHPSQARLPARTRAALARLAASPRVALGIVSGRDLRQLKKHVRLRNICYIGSHGLEWASPGLGFRSRTRTGRARALQRLATDLSGRLRGLPNIWIERKKASLAVHYRGASRRHARELHERLARASRQHAAAFRLLQGKKVFEFLPAGSITKGSAVQALVGRLRVRRRFPLVVYLGDDTTDEHVFARLRPPDLGIFVGRPKPTRARFYLRSPGQVGRFLEQICRMVP